MGLGFSFSLSVWAAMNRSSEFTLCSVFASPGKGQLPFCFLLPSFFPLQPPSFSPSLFLFFAQTNNEFSHIFPLLIFPRQGRVAYLFFLFGADPRELSRRGVTLRFFSPPRFSFISARILPTTPLIMLLLPRFPTYNKDLSFKRSFRLVDLPALV